jgi:hypothetical protein
MTTIVPGPGEDGYALRDEESAAEALGYQALAPECSDQGFERGEQPAGFQRYPMPSTGELAECNACGFRFDAIHARVDGEERDSCPCCEELRLHAELDALRAVNGAGLTPAESNALRLGARALAEVAAGLESSGLNELAAESASSAAVLDDLQRRSAAPAAPSGSVVEAEIER